MFCYQCEQNVRFRCLDQMGVCGKDDLTSKLQDILQYATQGLSYYTHILNQNNISTEKYDKYVIEALFTTMTNVNFDALRIKDMVVEVCRARDEAKNIVLQANIVEEAILPDYATFNFVDDYQFIQEAWYKTSIPAKQAQFGKTITGLQELVIYGLKGVAAYLDHALLLGFKDEEVYKFFHESLSTVSISDDPTVLLKMSMDVGRQNLKVMELLDKAHTSKFGNPEPSKVRITPIKGKAILVSGHDLNDLYNLLQQTEGLGINIYTHGEMLPAHGYPEIRKFKHLAGNYGGAWQEQQMEFDNFPGAILMTTNCIQFPLHTYAERLFTTGLVAWQGIKHISNGDYSDLIQVALEAPGFQEDSAEKFIFTGFGHNAVLSNADAIVEKVKSGEISRFFLIGGCDGARVGRNYYTDFAQSVPKDSIILTLACGKYRFNKLEFGEVAGLPRLMDVGQCNDAYSAIKIATALADALDTDINSMPLSFILSWYEQKAVAILLTLLSLGIKNIRLGPTLPQFIEPEVLEFLVQNFNIQPITTAEQDLQEILG